MSIFKFVADSAHKCVRFCLSARLKVRREGHDSCKKFSEKFFEDKKISRPFAAQEFRTGGIVA